MNGTHTWVRSPELAILVVRARSKNTMPQPDYSDPVFSLISLYSGTTLTIENGRLQTGLYRGAEPRL